MNAGEQALALRSFWRALAPSDASVSMPAAIAGVDLRNPVGLAAGLDKRCAYLDVLGGWGFGYVVGGTVTAQARAGNPKPRVLRIPESESLINALGFPGDGLERAILRLERLRRRGCSARVFVSVAALDEQETLYCVSRLSRVADAIELNISSPNTSGLRRFHDPAALRGLLDMLAQDRNRPLFVKLPPYGVNSQRDSILALARVCREAGVDGVTAANTIPVADPRLASGRGGLSGRAILGNLLEMLPEIRAEIGPALALNACGGISSADDARAAMAAGADTVQLYTALVYQGPALVDDICRGLRARPPERRV